MNELSAILAKDLDLSHYNGLTVAILGMKFDKFFDMHDQVPRKILMTEEQIMAFYSPWFGPSMHFRSVPLVVK